MSHAKFHQDQSCISKDFQREHTHIVFYMLGDSKNLNVSIVFKNWNPSLKFEEKEMQLSLIDFAPIYQNEPPM
jgi:hypothetical protein